MDILEWSLFSLPHLSPTLMHDLSWGIYKNEQEFKAGIVWPSF